jgi:phosphate acetyltransferase
LVARNVSHMVDRLQRNTLIITPSDREDILLAACMAELNGVPLAGVVLTSGGNSGPAQSVLELCDKMLKETGMPLLLVDDDSYVAAAKASNIDREVPMDDISRIEKVMDDIASHLDVDVLRDGLLDGPAGLEQLRLSPHAFMHQLVSL